MAPEVRGTTMVRPPWTIRVPESATAVSLHGVGRGFMLFAPEDVEDMLFAEAEEDAEGDLEEEAQTEAETEPLDPDEDHVEDETQTTDEESQYAWPSELLDINASPELMDQDSVEDEIDTTDSSEQARLALASDDFFDETRGPAVDESDATDSSNRAGRPGDFDDFFDEERQDEAFLADWSRSPEPLYSDIEPDGLDEELGDEENDDLDGEDEVPPVDTATQDKAPFDSFWDRAPDAETLAKKPIGEDTSMSRLRNCPWNSRGICGRVDSFVRACRGRRGDQTHEGVQQSTIRQDALREEGVGAVFGRLCESSRVKVGRSQSAWQQ